MESFSIWHLLILFIFLAILVVIYLYAKNYSKLINAIGKEYININPRLTFLIFIPIVGFIFYIILGFSLKDSLDRMFNDRKISVKATAVYISLFAFLAFAALTFLSRIPDRPFIAGIPLIPNYFALGSLICFCFNWIHVINVNKLILMCKTQSGSQHTMVFCRGCGKQIHSISVSCPHCGATQLGT